jgi:hypothetical protein
MSLFELIQDMAIDVRVRSRDSIGRSTMMVSATPIESSPDLGSRRSTS